jgi:putative ABC transport system permease protein
MSILQDLRYAFRGLAKNPAFAIVCALTIGLALGVNTTLYAVVSSVLLKPLPYAQPERLVDLYETFEPNGFGSVSPANFLDWRRLNHAFQAFSAYAYFDPTLNGAGSAERLQAIAATADLFETLGVGPAIGRAFVPGEDGAGAPRVVVISDGLWRRLGGERALIGKEVKLNDVQATIIGVMPPTFRFPAGYDADAWTPLQFSPARAAMRDARDISVIGRLRSGTTIERATSDMRGIAAELERLYPKQQARRGVQIRPMSVDLSGRVRSPLLRMFGFVGFVLLIACANVANLLMARAAFRRREIAVRVALGAGRGRLIRQLLVESVVLSLAGAVAGIAFTAAGVRIIARLAAGVLPRAADIAVDPGVCAFLFGLAVLTGIVFGVLPALSASRVNLQQLLREGVGGAIGIRQRPVQAMLVAEFTLALMLLAGAGLMLKSFLLLTATPSGFDLRGVVSMHVSLPLQKYSATPPQSFYARVLERLRATPGIEGAGFISKLPLQEAGTNGAFEIEGRPPEPGRTPRAELRLVSPGYFRAMGIPVLRGRAIEDNDTASSPAVMVVNQALADRYFRAEDPVGHNINAFRSWRIVGTVGNVRQASLDEPSRPEIYVPISQIPQPAWVANMVLVARGEQTGATIRSGRAAIQSVDPAQPVFAVRTMDEVVARSLADRKLYVWLFAVFGGLALVLAAAGMYGVMSYLIVNRRREFGIRVALGGTQRQILLSVIGHALLLAGIGAALGLAAAAALTRLLSALLYEVKPIDAGVFAATTAILMLVAIGSAWIPAWRATKCDAAIALRDE